MTRGKNEEREFLKRVDAMLAGGEMAGAEDAGDDLRGTVEFARKLVDLHEGPTPEFSQRLKSRLLIKLTEQDETARARAEDAPAERGWFWRLLVTLVPASPVWRSAAVSLVAIVAVVTVLWRAGIFTGTAGLDTPAAETVTSQAPERAIAPQAVSEMAVEETADGETAVTSMAAPASAPTAEGTPTYLQGAMEKSIATDMVVMADGVKITMQRIELSALGIAIEAVVSPGSALSDGQVVVASYSIDGGSLMAATDPTSRYLAGKDLLSLSWAGLNPALSDATTLTFTIERIGEHEGPWVFDIPLQD